jgi:hypothetical protein
VYLSGLRTLKGFIFETNLRLTTNQGQPIQPCQTHKEPYLALGLTGGGTYVGCREEREGGGSGAAIFCRFCNMERSLRAAAMNTSASSFVFLLVTVPCDDKMLNRPSGRIADQSLPVDLQEGRQTCEARGNKLWEAHRLRLQPTSALWGVGGGVETSSRWPSHFWRKFDIPHL